MSYSDWEPLVKTVSLMIELAPEYVVVQVHGLDGPDGGPYVQTLREADGAMTLEAASNVFLDDQISPDSIEILKEMGWRNPEPEDGLPNFYCTVDELNTSDETANFLTRTLRDVYGVTTGAVFELAPHEIFMDIIGGRYGVPTGMYLFSDDSDPRVVGR